MKVRPIHDCAVLAAPHHAPPGLALRCACEQLVTLELGYLAVILQSERLPLLPECRRAVDTLEAVARSHDASGAFAWSKRARECQRHLNAVIENSERKSA